MSPQTFFYLTLFIQALYELHKFMHLIPEVTPGWKPSPIPRNSTILLSSTARHQLILCLEIQMHFQTEDFSWLLLSDRDMLVHWNYQVGEYSNCVLCTAGSLKTRDHLFRRCSFSTSCWQAIGIQLDVTLDCNHMISMDKIAFNKPFSMEAFIVAAWIRNICKQRNSEIVNRIIPSLGSWHFLKNISLPCYLKGKRVFIPVLFIFHSESLD